MKTKISADISQEARELLHKFASHHERSFGYLIDRMIKKFCVLDEKAEVKRSEPKRLPSNFDEQFELLWTAKGKKGSKAKAREKLATYCKGESEEKTASFIAYLIADIKSRQDELGMAELHLTTYLSGKRWEQ